MNRAFDAAAEEAVRVDWRLWLGVRRQDAVLDATSDHGERARALARWAGLVLRIDPAAPQGSVATRAPSPTNLCVLRSRVRRLPCRRESLDWVLLDDAALGMYDTLDRLHEGRDALKPGGHVALFVRNRWAVLRLLRRSARVRAASEQALPAGLGLRDGARLLREAGFEVCESCALLPGDRAPRAIVPIDPRGPADAEAYALTQVWQRASPVAALGRRGLAVMVRAGWMRHLYPAYLIIGRKPC